ncbi:MAG: hypothetical protein CMG29_04485 [Candidatus Marinimicrobia bacterium]|jgi:hypothetical protein|nr:hypothetical protein [Candidatus Neomarinimicrobiota bacterium]MDP6032366.1 hypothetical protein [Candidatus Neomarinimicrobiota bacterium]MDP6275284.1 hypothetical protein [Candidatus Neomarinimicrobiota bacterium]MDP7216933.1 hypothetical protein [Candidatus Neomarinimicrobiota bacterium]MDP7437144.1 hypothetical protein [Candidatus Neomarinimicrobiota bacterium]|tara:strand:+ start:571 stop:939 length:369 start_codon:yes stop_codon:yes gene_type:complete
MKKALIPFLILIFSLHAKENRVDRDIWERYTILCARTEWVINSDHEYYMTGISRSYGLQAVRNANDTLYEVLINPPVLEEKLLTAGLGVLNELKKSIIEKKLTLPVQRGKSRITYYSFSAVN